MEPTPRAEPDLASEVAAATARFRLALLGGRYRGHIGQRRGTGPGSSLELHDFRDYAPGDDLRHIDWSGYARTDQLRIRLHEAEVAPIVELLLDTSPSMAVREHKQRAVRALAAAFEQWARQEGSTLRTSALGGGHVDAGALAFDGAFEPDAPRVPLRPGSVRVIVSDGLWQQDPAPMLRRVAAQAARVVFLQLLDPWERAPQLDEAVTLRDCETGARALWRLDARTRRAYDERLQRLCNALRGALLALGGDHVAVTAGPLAEICQRDLLPAGIVEPS